MSGRAHDGAELSRWRPPDTAPDAPAASIDGWYDASPVATMIVDPAGRIAAVNAALATLIGADAATLVGADPLGGYSPADRQRWQDAVALAALRLPQAGDSLAPCVELAGLQWRRADGTPLRHRRIERPMRASQGSPYRIVALIDEPAAAASDAAAAPPVSAAEPAPDALSAALRACPVPMLILDRRLTIVAVNRAFGDLSGYSPAEVIGRWPAFLGAEGPSGRASTDRPPLLRTRFEAMLDDDDARDEVGTLLTTRSGHRLAIRLQSSRLTDDPTQGFVVALLETAALASPLRAAPRAAAASTAPTIGAALGARPWAGGGELSAAPADRREDPGAAASAADDRLRRSIDEHGDMLLLLGPTPDGGPGARLRVLDCNVQVESLMGVDRQAVLNASGALLTHLSQADRQRFLTALRRARGAVGASDGPAGAHGPSELELTVNHPRRGDRLIRVRLLPAQAGSQQTLLIGEDISERRHHGRQAEAVVSPQRDVLVREVHHRIKNNLQGVAGLLRQVADRHPALASSLDDIAGQVQAIAQVHGLHVQDDGLPSLEPMIESVFMNLARNFGVPIAIESPAPAAAGAWRLPESEAVPVALIINELGTNAIKHNRPDGRVAVRWQADDASVLVEVGNQGALPKDFDFARLAGGASGLGLVKAMLPRRGAELTIDRQGDRVLARLCLRRPVLIRADGNDRAEAHS